MAGDTEMFEPTWEHLEGGGWIGDPVKLDSK
jgi:hypothetical protein